MWDAGKMLVAAGLAMVVLGVMIMAIGKVPYLGRLPGDLVSQRRNFTIYVPLASCLVISYTMTVKLGILGR